MTILETMKTSESEEKIHIVPVVKIETDRAWNSRKHLGDDIEGGPEEHSFLELVNSLKQDGQDTPIELKPRVEIGTSDDHYFLISGFRRFAAFNHIYSTGGTVKGLKSGCIKAYIRDGLTEVEALVRNGRENTGRVNLNSADTAYLIHRLTKLGLTETQISERLAVSLPWVNQLHTVYKGTCDLYIKTGDKDMTIFEHWRDAPGRVAFQTLLDLVKVKVEPRIKEMKYLELLASSSKKNEVRKSYARSMVSKDESKLADRFGLMLGKLENAGLIRVEGDNWKHLLEVGKGMKFGGATPERVKLITGAARSAYERGKLVG